MSVFILVCTFSGFCGLAGCPEGQGNHAIRARVDPEALLADFWTSAEPGLEPWPAIFQETGFAQEVWALFTAGALHGHWMLTVVPGTGDALLTHQYVGFGSDVRSARGSCKINQESI